MGAMYVGELLTDWYVRGFTVRQTRGVNWVVTQARHPHEHTDFQP